MIIHFLAKKETRYNLISTCWTKRHQRAPGGVAVAQVLGAAENGLVVGWSCGAVKTGFLSPLQAAALKHHPAAADGDRGEALGTVALGGRACWAITQTHQLSICGGNDMSSAYTRAVSQGVQHIHTVDLVKGSKPTERTNFLTLNEQAAHLAKHNSSLIDRQSRSCHQEGGTITAKTPKIMSLVVINKHDQMMNPPVLILLISQDVPSA